MKKYLFYSIILIVILCISSCDRTPISSKLSENISGLSETSINQNEQSEVDSKHSEAGSIMVASDQSSSSGKNSSESSLSEGNNSNTKKSIASSGLASRITSSNSSINLNVTMPPSEKLGEFNLDYYVQKFWLGNIVYHESICFTEQSDGSILSGTLMYKPEQIVSVRSTDLKITYEENKDFTVKDNHLLLTKNSRISVFPRSKYCTSYSGDTANAWLRITGTEQRILAAPDILGYQVYVTYTHADSWKGLKPISQANELPKTATKLKNKQNLKMVFFGDSITAGWDASGQNEACIDVTSIKEINAITRRAPFMPAWTELVTRELKNVYHYDAIVKSNRAAGGSTSYWGVQHAKELVVPQNPDLVVISFGMNEGLNAKESFQQNIINIIGAIHAECPNTEFLLVSCMMPNRDSVIFTKNKLKEQEDALYDIQSGRSDLAIGVVPVHSMFLSIHQLGKKYTDYSSNLINHPNDFAVRIYAQMILNALGA